MSSNKSLHDELFVIPGNNKSTCVLTVLVCVVKVFYHIICRRFIFWPPHQCMLQSALSENSRILSILLICQIININPCVME